MKFYTLLFTFSCLLFFSIENLTASPSDTSHHKLSYPNDIKLNLTAMVEFGPALVVSYERTVFPHQSFSVQAGYVTFPQLIGSLPDSIQVVDNTSQSGFRIGADYRFYFKNENKYEAPHGLYWGPFIDYFSFTNKRVISVTDTSFATGNLDFTGKLQILQAGINLGYQFVIKKRLSLDLCLFGPALAYYSASLKLDGDFKLNQENEYLQALYNFLINSFPLLGELSNGQTIKTNGRADLFFAGFRYSVCAGFRF